MTLRVRRSQWAIGDSEVVIGAWASLLGRVLRLRCGLSRDGDGYRRGRRLRSRLGWRGHGCRGRCVRDGYGRGRCRRGRPLGRTADEQRNREQGQRDQLHVQLPQVLGAPGGPRAERMRQPAWRILGAAAGGSGGSNFGHTGDEIRTSPAIAQIGCRWDPPDSGDRRCGIRDRFRVKPLYCGSELKAPPALGVPAASDLKCASGGLGRSHEKTEFAGIMSRSWCSTRSGRARVLHVHRPPIARSTGTMGAVDDEPIRYR